MTQPASVPAVRRPLLRVGCSLCIYETKMPSRGLIPVVAVATREIVTPNGLRAVCAKHARRAA